MVEKNPEQNNSKEFFQEQLAILRRQYKLVQDRIDTLEKMLNAGTAISKNKEDVPQQQSPDDAQAIDGPEISQEKSKQTVEILSVDRVNHINKREQPKASQSKQSKDMELDFGRFWLNKIGVVIFTLGIGFLISYTFKYFTPLLKISFGYFVSVSLFLLGIKFEKKKDLLNFGRVLIGGGWAMTYFTTFAMHHFEASRIIQNQLVDIALLAVVASGMVIHSMKYKSETMTSMALFIAYVTATLGAITNFTFISCLFLSIIILILAYKYQWMKMLFLGVGLTYFVHYFWIIPNINDTVLTTGMFGLVSTIYKSSLNLVFLSSYWLVFLLGLHLIKSKENIIGGKLAVANFLNFLLFYAMSYQTILDLFYDNRFFIVFGFGMIYILVAVLMKALHREKIYISDIVIGVMVVTLSIPLKFLPDRTLLIWIIEIPFLLSAGFMFKQKTLKFLSYFISIIFFLKFTFLCMFPDDIFKNVQLIWFNLQWYEFIYLVTALSFGACGFFGERIRRKEGLDNIDLFFNHVYSCFSFFYFSSFLWLVLNKHYISLGLSIELLGLFYLSLLFVSRRLRIYGYVLLPIIVLRSIFIDDYDKLNNLKWFVVCFEVLSFFFIYSFNRYLNKKQILGLDKVCGLKLVNLPSKNEGFVMFASGLILLISLIYGYIQWQWISLALGVAGVCIVAAGIIDKDKVMRVGGLLLFGLTLMRVVSVDLSYLDMIFKIVTFIFIGGIFLVVSYIYNNYMVDTKDANKN